MRSMHSTIADQIGRPENSARARASAISEPTRASRASSPPAGVPGGGMKEGAAGIAGAAGAVATTLGLTTLGLIAGG